jgi:hypothetical protein
VFNPTPQSEKVAKAELAEKKNVRYFSDVNIAGMVKSAFRPCECHGVGVLLVSDCSFASRPRRNFSPDTMKHGIENFGVSNRSEFDFRGTIHNESASDFFTGMCTFLCDVPYHARFHLKHRPRLPSNSKTNLGIPLFFVCGWRHLISRVRTILIGSTGAPPRKFERSRQLRDTYIPQLLEG